MGDVLIFSVVALSSVMESDYHWMVLPKFGLVDSMVDPWPPERPKPTAIGYWVVPLPNVGGKVYVDGYHHGRAMHQKRQWFAKSLKVSMSRAAQVCFWGEFPFEPPLRVGSLTSLQWTQKRWRSNEIVAGGLRLCGSCFCGQRQGL